MGGLDSRFSCMAARMGRLSFDLLEAVKNVVGCGSVWDLQFQAGYNMYLLSLFYFHFLYLQNYWQVLTLNFQIVFFVSSYSRAVFFGL